MRLLQDSRLKHSLIFSLIISAFYASSSHADIMVRVEESFNGQLPITALHWFGADRSTRDDGNRYVVTRLDLGKVYTIDRLAHNYKVTDLPAQLSQEGPADVRAIKSDETRTIGPWTAEKYEIIGAATVGMQIVIWASKDIQVDLEVFRKVMSGLARRPGSEWMAAYHDIDGFPVLQEVRMEHKGSSFHGQTRVVSVEERKAPAHIYQPPEDYRQLPGSNAE